MLYPELFRQLEAVRWDMERDIPWDSFDANLLTDEQAMTIKMNAITEWSALPATEMFLRDNQGDSDFSAFMSIWFFEEQKHALVLMEYLRRFRPELVPTEEELHEVRFEFDPAPALETLMLHFCVGSFCVLRAGAGCLGALLRVTRPLVSFLTCAEHPGSLRPEWRGLQSRTKDRSQQQGAPILLRAPKTMLPLAHKLSSY